MALTSFTLVTAEFMPGGLLTGIARELHVTVGAAGQAVTVTAAVGFVVAPTVGILVPRLDRRRLLTVLALAAAVSNLLVAVAPSLWALLLARVLLGAALSGFWAMSLTVVSTLVGSARIGRGMMVVNAGTTLATVLGVPAAIALSALVDWRGAFVLAAAVSVAVAVVLRVALPPVPAASAPSLRTLWQTLRRPGMAVGLTGHVLMIFGHMAAYAFIRVGLDRVEGLDAAGAAGLLLVFGVGGFVGNLLLGLVVDRILPVLRLAVPLLTGASVAAVALWPTPAVAVVAVGTWGIGFGSWLLVINTWIGRQAPDRLEEGGGLVVAGFQGGIAVGAAVGGMLVDGVGVQGEFLVAAAVAALGGVVFSLARSPRR